MQYLYVLSKDYHYVPTHNTTWFPKCGNEYYLAPCKTVNCPPSPTPNLKAYFEQVAWCIERTIATMYNIPKAQI